MWGPTGVHPRGPLLFNIYMLPLALKSANIKCRYDCSYLSYAASYFTIL